jgi:hypothetical protein
LWHFGNYWNKITPVSNHAHTRFHCCTHTLLSHLPNLTQLHPSGWISPPSGLSLQRRLGNVVLSYRASDPAVNVAAWLRMVGIYPRPGWGLEEAALSLGAGRWERAVDGVRTRSTRPGSAVCMLCDPRQMNPPLCCPASSSEFSTWVQYEALGGYGKGMRHSVSRRIVAQRQDAPGRKVDRAQFA